MAEAPQSILVFDLADCADCGKRIAELPRPLPDAGADFPWDARDYDALRLFMLEELAACFPERTRWTPADMEVVIVEVLADVLDQLSDMADRVAAEARYLGRADVRRGTRGHRRIAGPANLIRYPTWQKYAEIEV